MGDNKPISKQDLRSLFGSLLGGSTSTSKDTAPEIASGEDYRKSNQTLVIRNCQLKSELSKIKKEMDSLRFENESLRDRLSQIESATEDERIEMIVSQRVESRVKQIKFMVDRSVKFMQKTSDDLAGIFGNIDEQQENNSNAINERKSTQPLARKPTLSKVEESPLRRSSHPPIEVSLPSGPSSSSHSSETPRMVPPHPRRGKSPLRIRPQTPKRERGSTPTPSSPPIHPFDGILDSTRRKRSATLKIQSFKEPSLGTKLRRPAGFDPTKDYI
ncbi:hypothetical protein PENTCL1PPCAC_11409 [Pristionchus entomophagus]|uniref:Shugoshin C-terminal domain-containing protein n=1 Tax=Pristionchus entomophagus TaxID=358040 RepID=A0AAV5T6E3_9BILA|nr:hypothetical protein PENTCL1PPCAC_11409 [Pristionchus entomophagus]